MPCQALPADAAYGVLEVVDLALCRNPTTREVWSFARVQAAQVGVAQSAFLPTLDGRLTVGRVSADSQSANQRGASLTLSWLLFDFGARSANLEVARQLLKSAASTLDSVSYTHLDVYKRQSQYWLIAVSSERRPLLRYSMTFLSPCTKILPVYALRRGTT